MESVLDISSEQQQGKLNYMCSAALMHVDGKSRLVNGVLRIQISKIGF